VVELPNAHDCDEMVAVSDLYSLAIESSAELVALLSVPVVPAIAPAVWVTAVNEPKRPIIKSSALFVDCAVAVGAVPVPLHVVGGAVTRAFALESKGELMLAPFMEITYASALVGAALSVIETVAALRAEVVVPVHSVSVVSWVEEHVMTDCRAEPAQVTPVSAVMELTVIDVPDL